MARVVVGTFWADAARAGATSEVSRLVEEHCRTSPELDAFQGENDVRVQRDGVKRLRHPTLREGELEYLAFGADGRPDVGIRIYSLSIFTCISLI